MTVDLAYSDSGSGRPVVLLHAFPLSSRMWDAQRPQLEPRCRLLTPDLRGFGASPLGDEAPSLDVLADDVARWLDRLGLEKVVLGGLSMGGYVAMAFLRRHAARVAALVLADTKAGADAPPAVANRLAMAETLEAEGTARVLLEKVAPALVGETTRDVRPEVVDYLHELIEKCDPAAAAWAQRAMAARPDSFDTLRAIAVPALVVVGEEDELSPPAEAEAMAKAIPGGRGEFTIRAAGHLANVEMPDVFTAVLTAFLRGLDGAERSTH
jgi:pimeloyl-ACP methyl ester carboxylesterase